MISIFTNSYEQAQIKALKEIIVMPTSSDPTVYKEDRCMFDISERVPRYIHSVNDLTKVIRKNLFNFIDDAKIKISFTYWSNLIQTEAIIDKSVQTLKKDLHSRRCLVDIWKDNYRELPNQPGVCVSNFYARVNDNTLHFCSTARANDIVNCLFIDLIFLHHIRSEIA